MPKPSLKKALLGYKRALNLSLIVVFLLGLYFPLSIAVVVFMILIMELYLEVVAYQNNYYFFRKPSYIVKHREILIEYNNHYSAVEFKQRFYKSMVKDIIFALFTLFAIFITRCNMTFTDQICRDQFQSFVNWIKATIPFLSHV